MPAPRYLGSPRRCVTALALVFVLITSSLLIWPVQPALASAQVSSSVRGTDGRLYTVTNHLAAGVSARRSREWLLVWAGAANPGPATAPAPDFIAVIDATPDSPTYGMVANTATFSPVFQNEPHHLQYVWHKGNHIYAGGIISDTTYVLDPSRLPELRLTGVNLPADTPCGSAPDAFAVLSDGTAYASYMGGPNVSGPCTYTNGEVRIGNGFAGSPGEIVHIGPDGRTLSESPATPPTDEGAQLCSNIPALPQASCANPHGLGVREDLGRMVQTDFAEIRNFLGQTPQFDPHLIRDTVRIYDISRRNQPKLLSMSHLPLGPRAPTEQFAVFNESRLVMEPAVTHQARHRGAFVSTMWGGAVYYTPDITLAAPQWREVFDDEHAYRAFHPDGSVPSSGDGGSWLAVSPDDRFLFHTVLGAQRKIFNLPQETVVGMVYVLDISKLLAAGHNPRCRIDTIEEVAAGGREPDCPALVSVLPIRDDTTGGPHWGAIDNFRVGVDGFYHESSQVHRLAVANYFVNSLGGDGDHRVCIVNFSPRAGLRIDNRFRDEHTGQTCVAFNRPFWPHGAYGDARPHGVLFVVNNDRVR
jgi:hypothetical protein